MITIRSVTPSGREGLSAKLVKETTSAITQKRGARFDEQEFEDTKSALERALGDGGYAFAKVTAKAKVDIASHAADLLFIMEPGLPARYGEVQITGLSELPEEKVRSEISITKGKPYSRAELAEVERALQELNVFAGIEIRQDRSRPESGEVPIQVVLREGKLRRLKLGGGARFDVLRLSTHLQTGWEHKNFLGGMRSFEIDAKPGLTWYPLRLSNFEYGLQKVLPEIYTTARLRQPSFVLPRWTGILSAEYNAYPLLYPLPEGVDPAKETIIGYHELRALAGVERKWYFNDDDVTLRPSLNWQANYPFAYQNENTELDIVRVFFPEVAGELKLNLRPIPVDLQLSGSLQAAGLGLIWDDNPNFVSDIRVKPELRVQVDALERGNKKQKGKLILAGRLGFGFLFPVSYGKSLNPSTEQGAAAEVDPTDPDVIRDQQKLLFRAFYAGGPNSNRGYPYRAVGPHGPVGFLIPTGLNCSLAGRTVEDLPEGCIRPLGGFTLWEASFEVRYNFATPLGAVVFIDASDVTRDVGDIRLNVPHLSVGPGLRYLTPVGALRFDVGYRIPGAQALGQAELDPEDGRPGTEFFGVLPITLQLAIGEAF